jgi:katanin p80 WD40 repeat-containing subunit B1
MCQLIEPYGAALDPKENEGTEQKLTKESKLEKVAVDGGPISGFRSMYPEESKEIKNIYIDCKPLIFGPSFVIL